MKHKMMKYIFFLSIGVVLSIKALAGEQIQQMHEYFYPLKAGHFQYIANSSLEGPTAFRGLYGEDNCFKLNIDGKFVDWIYEAVKTKSTLICGRILRKRVYLNAAHNKSVKQTD